MGKEKVTIWLNQIRAPFLLLSVFLVFIGVAKAYVDGYVNWLYSILVLTGVVLTHISVNLFNELSDYETGIDSKTKRTPFSGGSGMMQKGKTNPKIVRVIAYSTLFIPAIIGLYFVVKVNYYIAVFMIIGGISIRFYTSHLSKYLLGEIFTGLSLGSLVVIGTYMVLSNNLNIDVIYLSLPVGLLTFLLLLLNEFPDADSDREGGRKHIVIAFGKEKAFCIYRAFAIFVFLLIILYPIIFKKSFIIYIGLLTLPLVVRIFKIAKPNLNNIRNLIPALGMNVMLVLVTDFLIGLGLILSKF